MKKGNTTLLVATLHVDMLASDGLVDIECFRSSLLLPRYGAMCFKDHLEAFKLCSLRVVSL